MQKNDVFITKYLHVFKLVYIEQSTFDGAFMLKILKLFELRLCSSIHLIYSSYTELAAKLIVGIGFMLDIQRLLCGTGC